MEKSLKVKADLPEVVSEVGRRLHKIPGVFDVE